MYVVLDSNETVPEDLEAGVLELVNLIARKTKQNCSEGMETA